jgi:U3 small nucleolar RNA-associated protein 23
MQEATKLDAQDAAHASAEPPRKKRKGPKGPNPLSVKKKKAQPDARRPPRTRSADVHGRADGATHEHAQAAPERAPSPTEDGADDTGPTAPRGHKRKRRKKAPAGTAQPAAAADVDYSDLE